MAARTTTRIVGATALLTGVACLAQGPARAASQPVAAMEPIPLSIGGGAVDSAAFHFSSALADIVSRPPGLPECDPTGPCGVPGVVGAARTYDDSASLLKALLDGQIATAVIPSLPLLGARCAAGVAAPPDLTVLKVLYRQPLYIVTRILDQPIDTPEDWVGKTIVTGPAGSDADRVTEALIDAYKLPRSKIKILQLPTAQAVAAIRDGVAPVGVFLGHVFDPSIASFMQQGYTLMSLPDSTHRARLLQALPVFEVGAIPPDTYPGIPAISTLLQPVPWVAGPMFDPKLAQALVEDVSEPHNLSRLAEQVAPVAPVPEGRAFERLPIALSDAARSFATKRGYKVETLTCPPPPAPPPAPPAARKRAPSTRTSQR